MVVLWDTVGWIAEAPYHVCATTVLRYVWAGCFCMAVSYWPTSVWNELLVFSFRRHRRWKHSGIILLESHLTQHIRQILCFVGQGSFPLSIRLIWSVWHKMAALHRLEKLTAKRLLNPGCSCCFGFSWGIQLNPTESSCQLRDWVTRGEAPYRSDARDQAGTKHHEAKAKQKVGTAELEIQVNRKASERRHSIVRETILEATGD